MNSGDGSEEHLISPRRILLTSSVLINLLNHVYSDAHLSTIGILGGRILENGDALIGYATPLER